MRTNVPLMMIVALAATACRSNCGTGWRFFHGSQDCTATTAGVRTADLTDTGIETDADTDADSDSDTDPQTDGLVTTGMTGDTGFVETHSGTTVGHSGSTASTADSGSVVTHSGGGPGDSGLPIDTDEPADTDTDSDSDGDADTDVPAETADTAEPCVPVNWYFDGDRDGATGFDRVELSCPDPGAGWTRTPPSDCDDADPFVHPGAVEVANDGIDQDCVGGDLVIVIDDTGLVDTGLPDCAPGESRFSGSYTSPGGATITAVKIQIYNPAGSEIRRMLTIVDGVDGWSVDASVQGVVMFSNETCYPDTYTFYASALYNGQPGYDCSGNANPNYVPYGTWTFGFDGVAGTAAYVNNYEINGAFPFGYGGGCEAKAIR